MKARILTQTQAHLVTFAINVPIALLCMSTPIMLYAQETTWLDTVATESLALLGALMPVLMIAAFLVFVWGMIVFIHNAGDDARRMEGRQKMVWGIVIFFIVVSIWGLLQLLQAIFGIAPPGAIIVPRTTLP